MFIPSDYQNYKYLVEAHDNYFILSTSSHISGSSGDPDDIDVIYQYINPSIYTIEDTYYSESSISFNDVSDSFSTSDFDRGDFPVIFICNFLTCFIVVWIINQLSKLVYRGGVFGGF